MNENSYAVIEAHSRKAKKWKPNSYTLHELAEKLRQTAKRTDETMAEYAYWGRKGATLAERERRAVAKDTYSYVCGISRNGHRGKDDITGRTMLTYDLDSARAGVGEDGWKREYQTLVALNDVACICHQTHSSTPEAPRLRMILPASREVTPLEYRAVTRKFAEQAGILAAADPCSELVNQLMYAPTASHDAPDDALTVLENDGEPVDVDAVLRAYGPDDEWEDPANWPMFPHEDRVALTESIKLGDPRDKTDVPIIAAFCRAYDIHDAIETYLADVYEPTIDNNRYRYINGDGPAGALVYGGIHLYSMHTHHDPAADGHSHNAYDLVRIHLFGHLDKDVDRKTTSGWDLPSNREMVALASGDPLVKEKLKEIVAEKDDAVWADILTQPTDDAGDDAGDDGEKKTIPYFFKLTKEGTISGVQPALLAKWTREKLRYLVVRDRATDAKMFYAYRHGVYEQFAIDDMLGLIKQEVMRYSLKVVQMRQIKEAFEQIRTDPVNTKQSDLDSDEGIINFRNGILRLSDMTLLPHDPKYLSTIQMPCDWVGKPTPTPVFDGFMDKLTEGDAGKKKLLMQVMGIAVTNIPGGRMKKALFIQGKGDTGKSQFRKLLGQILGDAVNSYADLEELEKRFGTSNLYGKRIVGTPDMKYIKISELSLFKKISAGDPICVEFKGMSTFNYVFRGVLCFCMNKLPAFGGDTGEWVYERIMVVNCDNVIPKKEQDWQLLEKMQAEAEGILYQAVLAAKEVIANGYRYDEPDGTRAAREDYQVDNSTVLSFFKECMRQKADGEKLDDGHTVARVYEAYRNWCEENSRNGYRATRKEFRQGIASYLGRDYDKMTCRYKDGVHYVGLSLTADARQEFCRGAVGLEDFPGVEN